MPQLPEEPKNEQEISLETAPKAEGNILKFYLNILKRNIALIIIFSILGLLGAWLASREDPIVYVGKFEILVEPVTSEQKLTDPAVLARSQGVLRDNILEVDYPTILKILKSPLLLNNIAEDLHNLYPKISQDFILQNLQKDLSVQRVQEGSSRLDFTKIIEVTFQSSNPKFTESVLKVAAENFLEYSKQERENSLESGTQFIDSQIPKIQKKIAEIQNQQEILQKKNNLVDPRATGNALVETHLLAGQKIVNLQSEINELSILSGNLQKKLGLTPAQALLASKLSQNPERQKLLSQLYQVEAEISLKSQSLSPKHPTLVKLIKDKANLENLIQQVTKSIIITTNNPQPINKKVLEFQDGYQLSLIRELVEVQNKIDSLSYRYKTLLDEQEKLNQNLKTFPNLIKEYAELERQLSLNIDTLNQLASQRQSLSVEGSQKKTPWQLIAEPKIPRDKKGKPTGFPPSSKKKLIAGIGGGLLFAILLAILLEKYRNIFHESSDVEYSFAEPILTKLNLFKSKINTKKEQKAWEELYTNLYFILPKKSQYTLLIASLNPEDGQTYVTAHLAHSVAKLGQKVLIIDNHPTTPETYKDILTIAEESSHQSCHSLMFSFPSIPTLSFFPLHKILDNEYYSINSLETHSLLESIAQGYNLIIYNSSNFLDLYDLSLLAEKTEGIIFTIRLKHTPYSNMKKAIARIRKYNLKLLGFVVIS